MTAICFIPLPSSLYVRQTFCYLRIFVSRFARVARSGYSSAPSVEVRRGEGKGGTHLRDCDCDCDRWIYREYVEALGGLRHTYVHVGCSIAVGWRIPRPTVYNSGSLREVTEETLHVRAANVCMYVYFSGQTRTRQ